MVSLLSKLSTSKVQEIAKLTEQDLQNLFHCEVFVKVNVNVTHKPSSTSRDAITQTPRSYHLG